MHAGQWALKVGLVGLACASLSFLPTAASAGVILRPASASTTMGEFYPVSHLVDGSGLSSGYSSLVTDFDTYIATNPTHFHGFGANVWGAPAGVRSGFIDFNLGGSRTIESMAFWSAVSDPSAIKDFVLLADDSADFVGATTLGTFTASNTLGSGSQTAAQVFQFAATSASYIRMQVLNTQAASSYSTVMGEVAFEVVPSVPEPGMVALVGLGLAGAALSSVRRRRRT